MSLHCTAKPYYIKETPVNGGAPVYYVIRTSDGVVVFASRYLDIAVEALQSIA